MLSDALATNSTALDRQNVYHARELEAAKARVGVLCHLGAGRDSAALVAVDRLSPPLGFQVI
jgi:hypothetical protein